MSVSTGAYLKSLYSGAAALGDKAISSDSMIVIEGHEDLSLLIKQFPMPVLTPAGEIEIPGPLGTSMYQPQQAKTYQQGGVTIMETVNGHVRKALQRMLGNGGKFNAKIYEGTKDSYTRVDPILGCFFVLDNPDRDWENRSQVLQVTGTLFFHYFGPEE